MVSTSSWRFRLLALAVLFLVATLLVFGIRRTYMHHDERLVYHFTRNDLAFTVQFLGERDTHPPLWFSFFWVWRQFTGDSEFAGRMQAILFSLPALAVVYQTGRQWFGAPRYGIFAMAVLGSMALYFQYALEIRPYGLVMLLASLSMFSFHRWITRQQPRWAAAYAVTVAAILYVHYFQAVLVIVQGFYFLVYLFRHPSRRLARQAAGVAALAFLLWSPWFPSFLNQIKNLRDAELVGGNARGIIGAGTTTEPTSPEAVARLAQVATNGQIALYGAALVVGLVALRRQVNYRLALAWAFGVPALSLLINLVAAIYAPRYILNFIIGLALVIGAGLAAIPSRGRWAALVGFAAVSLWAMPSQLPKNRVPYRDLAASLAAASQPGDVLFYDRANERDDIWQREIQRQLSPELRAAAMSSVEAAEAARRVWFITADWFDPGVQAHFKTIEQTHPLQKVFGDCTSSWCFLIQLLEAPPWTQPQVFGEDMAFWGVDVDEVSAEKISARLWWRVRQTPGLSYSIGLQLMDAGGALAAQNDGPIRHYRDTVVETSLMQPGKIYVDFRDIILPANLAPGIYQLALVVYDWQTGERLRLADSADYLALDTLTLP